MCVSWSGLKKKELLELDYSNSSPKTSNTNRLADGRFSRKGPRRGELLVMIFEFNLW